MRSESDVEAVGAASVLCESLLALAGGACGSAAVKAKRTKRVVGRILANIVRRDCRCGCWCGCTDKECRTQSNCESGGRDDRSENQL